MRSRSRKRMSVLGFVAAAVLAMAGTAFACTTIQGKITITGTNGTTINGGTGGVTYLGGNGDFPDAGGTCDGNARLDMTSGNGATLDFNLTVAPYSCGLNPEPKVSDGVWEVRWVEAEDEIDTTPPYPTCHYGPGNSSWVDLGVMKIGDGHGSGDYSLLASNVDAGPATMVGPGNICVNNSLVSDSPPVVFMKWTI